MSEYIKMNDTLIYNYQKDIIDKKDKEIERLNNIINELEEAEALAIKYLKNQLQQKENIIKEVRELINYYGITPEQNDDTTCRSILKQFLEILDKGADKDE